jgi:hypothetical protein
MTPVALWTNRLPGLRRLPRKRSLWLAGLLAAVGLYGAVDGNHAYLAGLTIAASAWAVWRHRWPTELPVRLRSQEPPQGPDERAVMIEVRQQSILLGWDVGILWFEKGGVGFVGRTVSFVVPRSIMNPAPEPEVLRATFRAPQLTAKVFDTTVGIVPLAPEMRAQMTLARIEALPNAVTSETILPPTDLHPDLLQRAMEVRRREIVLNLLIVANVAVVLAQSHNVGSLGKVAVTLAGALVILYTVFYGANLPSQIRNRLPLERRRKF